MTRHRFRPVLLQGYQTPSLRCTQCYAWDDDDNLPTLCPRPSPVCAYPECGGNCWECQP